MDELLEYLSTVIIRLGVIEANLWAKYHSRQAEGGEGPTILEVMALANMGIARRTLGTVGEYLESQDKRNKMNAQRN